MVAAGVDSFADIFLHDPLALLAGYVAAPVVLAVAALHQLLHVRVVATAAAHQVTVVAAQGGFIALPESRPKKKKEIKQVILFGFLSKRRLNLQLHSKTFSAWEEPVIVL